MVWMALVWGCQVQEAPSGVSRAQAPARLTLMAQKLSFPPVAAGEVSRGGLVVRNEGAAPLTLGALQVEGPDFQALIDPVGLVLGPNQSLELPLRFQPQGGGRRTGWLRLFSDDPAGPSPVVELEGSRLEPYLQISPLRLDFGPVPEPCGAEQALVATNTGEAPLRGLEVWPELSLGLSLEGAPRGPVDLWPGESLTLKVRLQGQRGVPPSGQVAFTHAEGDGQVFSRVEGSLGRAGWVEDVMTQAPGRAAVLVAVDRGVSMNVVSSVIADRAPEVIEAAASVGSAWSMGWVTGDEGCVRGEVLTAESADPVAVVREAVRAPTSPWSTRLLDLADLALGRASAGGCNAGLFQPSAPLHVVVVSQQKSASLVEPAVWLELMSSALERPDLLTVSAVVDPHGHCGELSPDYLDAARLSGGLVADLCDQGWFYGFLDVLRWRAAVLQHRFPLSTTAMPGTVEVEVNGEPWLDGWSLEQSGQEITFEQVPPAGAELRVRYAPAGLCEE
jgi:hypothetical protein